MSFIGLTLEHAAFGTGIVTAEDAGKVTVSFAGACHRLSIAVAAGNGTLHFDDPMAQEEAMKISREYEAEKKRAEVEMEAERRRAVKCEDVNPAFMRRLETLRKKVETLCELSAAERRVKGSDGITFVALHEAGHAVMHELLDPGKVIRACIKPDESGAVYFDDHDESRPNDIWLMEYVLTGIAGHAAEALYDSDIKVGIGSDCDYNQLVKNLRRYYCKHRIIRTLYPKCDNQELKIKAQLVKDERFFFLLAQDILAENEDALLAVAIALQDKRRLKGDDIRTIMEDIPRKRDAIRRFRQYVSWYRRNPVFFEKKREQYLSLRTAKGDIFVTHGAA